MIHLPTIQKQIEKWSKRKHGASTDPQKRLALMREVMTQMEGRPWDTALLAHLFIYMLDYSRVLKVDAETLLFLVDKQNQLNQMRLEREMETEAGK